MRCGEELVLSADIWFLSGYILSENTGNIYLVRVPLLCSSWQKMSQPAPWQQHLSSYYSIKLLVEQNSVDICKCNLGTSKLIYWESRVKSSLSVWIKFSSWLGSIYLKKMMTSSNWLCCKKNWFIFLFPVSCSLLHD